MKKFFEGIVKFRKPIIITFFVLAAVCAVLQSFVNVNYNIEKYLPDDSPSKVALDTMEEEFEGGITNTRVMIKGVTVPEALDFKEKLENINGVTEVTWLDDAVDLAVPLSAQDEDMVEAYYKDNAALFSVVVDEDLAVDAIAEIRELAGDDNAVSGSAVNTADAHTNTISEVNLIAVISVVFVFIVLLISTDSWAEPVVVMIGLGVAILLNAGTNLMFGTVSFITHSACNVLQLAVSLDYSVFLIHRFEEEHKKTKDPKKAMSDALSYSLPSIISSGLTTIIGFLAVILMQFKIGPDVGLPLAKGVVFSLITTFIFMPALILATHKWIEKTKHKPFLPSFNRFGKLVGKVTLPLCVLFVLSIAPAFLAYMSNSYYYGASKLFTTETRVGRDTAMIEDTFGESDTYVLMVKSGDRAVETALSNDLHNLKEVTSIISYVDTVGSTIPNSYLDETTYQKLDSGNYSRFVISVAVPYEGDETFELVEEVRDLAEKYYGDDYLLTGTGVVTYDMKETITADMMKVNAVAILAVFVILAVMLKSALVPLILILAIETAIAINLSFPYFEGQVVFYTASLIISSLQLGATVDYAILATNRYKENRLVMDKKSAVSQTVTDITSSILVSGGVLTLVGFLMSWVSSNQLLSQLGLFIGRGALISLLIVILVLPGMLYLCDSIVMGKRGFKAAKRKIKSKRENK